MVKFIKAATNEFEQNGRSSTFIAMENRICKQKKPLHIYWFARYAKGANVVKLQKFMEEYGSLEQCYYYQQNVQGSQLRPFVKKAIGANDRFWTEKFIELAEDLNQYEEIEDLIKGFERMAMPLRFHKSNFDISYIMDLAEKEYDEKGRSEYFIQLENLALHAQGGACARLFSKYVSGASVKNFERIAILKGDPFDMYFGATEIEGCDKQRMLKALEIAKLDYIEIEKSLDIQRKHKQTLMETIKRTTNEARRNWLISQYNQISFDNPEYIAQINNRYIPRISYMIKHNNNKL